MPEAAEPPAGGVDFFRHWPSVVHLTSADAPSPLHQCPLGLHMVLWAHGEARVRLRLFHKTDAAKFGFGQEPEGGALLHYPRFRRSGFEEGAEGSPDVNFAELSLSANQYAFVPNNMMVSMARQGAEGSTLFRSCLLDASNLNVFRESLTTAAQASAYEEALLPTFMAPSFNISLNRDPADTEARFMSARRLAASSAETADVKKAVEEPSGSTIAPSPKRDRRNRGVKKNVKDWSDANKWKTLLVGLTVPPATPATVKWIGRTNATFEWTGTFNPKADDMTRFGFNATVCESTDADGEEEEAADHCFSLSLVPGESKELQQFAARKRTEDDVPATTYRIFRENLVSGTKYRLRLKSFYSTYESQVSDWTTFVTAAEAPPLGLPDVPVLLSDTTCTSTRLTFRGPYDNGGQPILGYFVFARHGKTHKHLNADWNWWGQYPAQAVKGTADFTLTVQHLLPNTEYQFKLQAYNKLGNSTLSLPTEFVKLACVAPATEGKEDETRVIYGVGSLKHFARSHSLEAADSDKPLVTMDDAKQTLSCSDHSGVQADVWTSHYSPKLFKVVAETAFAAPYLLQSVLTNPSEIFGKIAVVQRGIVPIVYKVQLLQVAGAVGVIVADDGRCETYDQACAPGATKADGEFWACHDMQDPWLTVKIPVVLIRRGIDDAKLGRCLDFPRYTTANEASETTEYRQEL
jgi:hypothetical protein